MVLLFHYVQIVYYLSVYILSKEFNIKHKKGDNMNENKKNEELIKFKKQWFNEDNQPIAGIELTLPPDIGSMLDSNQLMMKVKKVIMNKFNLYASIRVLFILIMEDGLSNPY